MVDVAYAMWLYYHMALHNWLKKWRNTNTKCETTLDIHKVHVRATRARDDLWLLR